MKRSDLTLGALGVLLASASLAWAEDPAALRQRVLANIQLSREARASSKYSAFAAWNREYDKRGGLARLKHWLRSRRPRSSCPGTTYGPAAVPHRHQVGGNDIQPSVLFDKGDRRVKRQVLRQAGRLRLKPDLGPWAKVERVQQVIRDRVSHAGNELDVTKNPNPYTRYNHRVQQRGEVATLGDYLSLRKVVCREFAFLTQAALEVAGVESRLARGTIRKNGKVVGGHAWNEIKVGGQWYIVDTTNPQFNRVKVNQATSSGTANGWIWERDTRRFCITPRH
jgi:hypothetical protein